MNPFVKFNDLYQKAILELETQEVSPMCLSTVDAFGCPHNRMVSFKGIYENQFLFYSHYKSHKGEEISFNTNVCLLFFWQKLKCQIRIEGQAFKGPQKLARNYWSQRPREARLSTILSIQSQKIESYQKLFDQFKEENEKNEEIPFPIDWGAYLVRPTYFEFWEGGAHRLHLRCVYKINTDGAWVKSFLSP